jgi:hypothetical protein
LDGIKIVSIPVGALILIAGFLGIKSIGDLKATLEAEARRSTQVEIGRMQGEIRATLAEQFKTPTLQKLIEQAAEESTKKAAEPLIKNEVSTQVRERVDAERPTIAATVTQQTQAAVKQMGPSIDSLVKGAVDAKISTSVDPIIKQVKDEADLQLLITRMNADDGVGFDSLMRLSGSGESGQRTLIFSALRSVFVAHNQGLYTARTFQVAQTDEQLVAHLSDADPFPRQAALDALLSRRNLALLPRIVEMMRSDSSLNVRCSAYRAFDNWTHQSFQCLDADAAMDWWQKNKQSVLPTQ